MHASSASGSCSDSITSLTTRRLPGCARAGAQGAESDHGETGGRRHDDGDSQGREANDATPLRTAARRFASRLLADSDGEESEPDRSEARAPDDGCCSSATATPSRPASVLPGRAPGLNLSDAGRAQAQRTAELIADGSTVDAVYTSSLERARQTAAPIAAATGQTGQGRPRPHRVRLRRVDRRAAGGADEEAGVVHRAAQRRRRFGFPAARASSRCNSASCRRSSGCGPPTRAERSCACPTPTRSRRPSPMPSAPTSTCSSASSSARPRSACWRSSTAARSCCR